MICGYITSYPTLMATMWHYLDEALAVASKVAEGRLRVPAACPRAAFDVLPYKYKKQGSIHP